MWSDDPPVEALGLGVNSPDSDRKIPGRPRFFAVDPWDNTLEFVQFEADHW